MFAICPNTVNHRIRTAAEAAGLEGDFGAQSPRLGMIQDLSDHYGIPPRHRSNDLAMALAPHYLTTVAA